MFKENEIVQHLNGVELIVKKSNEVVTTCEYLHEKDYIQSKFMGVKSVTKVAICLTGNLRRTTNEQLNFKIMDKWKVYGSLDKWKREKYDELLMEYKTNKNSGDSMKNTDDCSFHDFCLGIWQRL